MCGIAGFNFVDNAKTKLMLNAIKHRGPDDEGIFENDFFTLGHVRLSILDLSPLGHQPMKYKNLIIVYNGEVYNYKEIRKILEKDGYPFSSNTDTEVVLKAFHKWGIDSVNKFRGMFAFAVLDIENKKVFLFRDRVGVKPLYYYYNDDVFIFSSELKSIKFVKKLEINPISLCFFFQFGYIPREYSIYKNTYKLLPGHFLVFDIESKQIFIKRYYNLLENINIDPIKKENIVVDELENILIESFKYRMISDVPVGVFLSGGVDSSIVTALLQKHFGNINTFTIGFKETKYDESNYAKQVANYLGTEHYEKILKPEEAKQIIYKFTEIYDEPFGDSSGIPTTLVSRIAKENGMKVVLSADGGDEIFCGYNRYWWSYKIGRRFLKLFEFSKSFIYILLTLSKSFLFKLPIHNIEHKYHFLLKILKTNTWQEIYETILSNYRDDELYKLLGFKNKFKKKYYFDIGEKIHPMQGMMLWDFYNYLPDDILVKVDRATMYNSIEGREPLLDHNIIEYALKMPFHFKYKNSISKYVLKKILEKYLPKNLIYRDKMGFGIPIFEWFKSDLLNLFDEYFEYEEQFLNMKYVKEMLFDFKQGKSVNVNKLWFVLVYKMWFKRYMEEI